MCSPAICQKCLLMTWRGCGKHVEQALRNFPPDQRCQCPRWRGRDCAPQDDS